MISSFGKFAKGFGAKVVLTALTLSMIVFWGLGGLTNLTLSKNKPAIEVGKNAVTMKQLAVAFDAERQKMGTMMGGVYVSPAQGLQNGLLLAAVQSQVIANVQQLVRDELGLAASDNAVRKYVERNPAFSDALGNFDKNIFYAYLNSRRMSENELARQLRDELAMNHLNQTVINLGYQPKELAKLAYKHKNEKRSVVAVLVEPDRVIVTKQPTNDELKEYFEAYADNFILPEYRSISIVEITPDSVANKIEVSEEELNEAFDEQKNSFIVPEKRQVLQMMFETEADAKNAKEGLTIKSFKKVASTKAHQTEEQTDFGLVSKNEMAIELAEPTFSAKAGDIIGPVQSQMGWHLIAVTNIQAGSKPADSVIKAEIKKKLAADKAYGTMETVVRELEDALGSGKSFDEATKEMKLSVKSIGTFDATGTKQDGSTLSDEMKSSELLESVFALEQDEASAVIEHKNGYIVARVDKIIPSTVQEFEAAKPALKKLWIAEQQKAMLEGEADALVKNTKAGLSLQTSAAAVGFDAIVETDITRSTAEKLSTESVALVFAQDQGRENTASYPVQGGILVATVTDIKSANPDKDSFGLNVAGEIIKNKTGEGMAQEVMGSYAEEFGVTVNEREIKDAFSIYEKEE